MLRLNFLGDLDKGLNEQVPFHKWQVWIESQLISATLDKGRLSDAELQRLRSALSLISEVSLESSERIRDFLERPGIELQEKAKGDLEAIAAQLDRRAGEVVQETPKSELSAHLRNTDRYVRE